MALLKSWQTIVMFIYYFVFLGAAFSVVLYFLTEGLYRNQ